ncbi:MAG TPA: hypothetical protein VHE14_06740, partial [Solirubrobacteraceae bacterium]|nr:hypothetical protein [Solirubrobacteraceae bacterium]
MPHPHPHQHQVAAMPRQLRHYLSGLRHEFGHVLRASSTLHLHLRNRVLGLLLASAVVDVIAAVG